MEYYTKIKKMYISNWYNSLIKSSLNPPASVFGPVWSILYTLMASSFILYGKSGGLSNMTGVAYFVIQLTLNILWPIVFFTLKNIPLSLLTIVGLLIYIILTIRQFFTVNKYSAYLLIPYLLWTGFATYLNGYIYWYN